MTKKNGTGTPASARMQGVADIIEAPIGLVLFGAELNAIEIANHEYGQPGRA